MSQILIFLQRVHENVHVFAMKANYSEPKIFTGGIDVSQWKKLDKTQQDAALKKDWYVYYSFRNPSTQKLQRQPNIKAGANKYKTFQERMQYLKKVQQNLVLLLQKGYNPYKNNDFIFEDCLLPKPIQKEIAKTKQDEIKVFPSTEVMPVQKGMTIRESFALALTLKEKVLSKTSFPSFKSNVIRFEKWLLDQNIEAGTSILQINRKVVTDYLNFVLTKTSPRTRNNTRIDLSSLFQVLEDNDIISENFIRKINVLKAVPERNKTYTTTLQEQIYDYMEQNDPILLLFVKFISYNFLRPIEVCRLRIEDIDIKDRKLYVRAKNAPVKIKIIPEILVRELPDFKAINSKEFLFTPNGIGGEWMTSETDKRDYFSKRFKKVKDHFGLGTDYGLYSFRHTFITRLYNEFAKSMTPFEAKSKLMLITGHATMDALEKYLRDIDAVLPEDYSEFLS